LLYYNNINIYMDFLIDINITLVRFNCGYFHHFGFIIVSAGPGPFMYYKDNSI